MPKDVDELERALHVRVPDWFLSGDGFGEFNEPIDPAKLLDASSCVIWGGQMLPDSVPLWGNGCGDVLALRFKPDGEPLEVVEWLHEGALWHPSGLVEEMPNPSARWRGLCDRALKGGLSEFCEQHGAVIFEEELKVSLEEVQTWLTDSRSISPQDRRSISQVVKTHTGKPVSEGFFEPDWNEARTHARAAAEARPDLAWPGAVLGRVSELENDREDAARWYAHGVRAFATTRAFVDAWRPLLSPGMGFLRDALTRMGPGAMDEQIASALSGWEALRTYWLRRAERELRQSSPLEAFASTLRAGWDEFVFEDMGTVLDRLRAAAQKAGSRPLEALAHLHLESFASLNQQA